MAKVNLFPDFRELFASLNSAKVKYLLIGGYAVIFHGYRRATDDLDVWIAVSPENAERVASVLYSWGGFTKKSVMPEMFLEPGKAYIFGREPVRIDILTGPSGVVFDQCYERRIIADLDGITVPIISLTDLRTNKLASGRAKDIADLENLPTEPDRPIKKLPRKRKRK